MADSVERHSRMAEVTDNALVAQCRRGVRTAFNSIFERYERPVYRLALQLLGNHDDAMDALQTSFVKAFTHLPGYDNGRPFAPWLFRIARNECIDVMRRRQRAARHAANHAHDPRAPYDDPSVLAEKSEAKARLWKAIQRLSNEHKEALVLREFHGMSYRELAETLEIPIGTVMSRLAAARKKLRSLLENKDP